MLLPIVVVLLVLLAGAALALALLKRHGAPFGAARQGRRLKLVERLAVTRRTAVLLVEYDGRPLLLGQAGDHISLLEAKKSE